MEITPQEVQQKRFDEVKRGFDPQQVGHFLDVVAGALADRDRQLHEAQTEIAALGKAVSDLKQNEEAFRLTMTVATEAKEEMLRRAEDEAARIEAEARAAAEVVVERARTGAEDRLAELKREVAALEAERNRLQEQGAGSEGAAESGRPSLELVVDR